MLKELTQAYYLITPLLHGVSCVYHIRWIAHPQRSILHEL